MTTLEFATLSHLEQLREARAAMQRLVSGMKATHPEYAALSVAAAVVGCRLESAEAGAASQGVPA